MIISWGRGGDRVNWRTSLGLIAAHVDGAPTDLRRTAERGVRLEFQNTPTMKASIQKLSTRKQAYEPSACLFVFREDMMTERGARALRILTHRLQSTLCPMGWTVMSVSSSPARLSPIVGTSGRAIGSPMLPGPTSLVSTTMPEDRFPRPIVIDTYVLCLNANRLNVCLAWHK